MISLSSAYLLSIKTKQKNFLRLRISFQMSKKTLKKPAYTSWSKAKLFLEWTKHTRCSALLEHTLLPQPYKHFTSAHQDKALNAMPLKDNVKTCPMIMGTTSGLFLLFFGWLGFFVSLGFFFPF